MKKEIEEIINTTSMGKLERKAVIKSLLNLHNVIMPKVTLCRCGKEYSDNDKEHGMCHKCWKEIKD